MKMKKIAAGLLAAVVLATSAPAAVAPVTAYAAATNATPEQEVAVKKPSKLSFTAKKDTVKVTIKAVKGATGYQVQYSTSKKLTSKTTKSKITKKNSYTLKNLKSNTTYYVRVRSYTLDENGKKVYSKWTSIKKVKTSK